MQLVFHNQEINLLTLNQNESVTPQNKLGQATDIGQNI